MRPHPTARTRKARGRSRCCALAQYILYIRKLDEGGETMDPEHLAFPPDYLKVPERINMAAVTVDRQVAAGHGDRAAIYYEDQRITYRELQRRVNQCGNALLRLGVRRGDRFFIRATNSPEYVTAVLAGFKIGAVPIPTNS